MGFRAPRKEQILPSCLGSIFQRTGPRAINNPGTVIASRASCPGSGLGAAAASPRRARGRSGSADPQGAPNPPCPGWNSPGCSIRTLEPGQINNRRLEGAPAAIVKALLGRVCTVPRLQMSRRGIFSPPRIQDSGMQPFPGRSLSLAMTPPALPTSLCYCPTAQEKPGGVYKNPCWRDRSHVGTGSAAHRRWAGMACAHHWVTWFPRKTQQDRHGVPGARLPLWPGE